MKEDRSSQDEPVAVSIRAARAGGEVRLTAAATAMRGEGWEVEWVVKHAMALLLPWPEFGIEVGVKVERGYGRALEPRLLPAALVDEASRNILPRADELAVVHNADETTTQKLAKVSVRLIAVELVFTWRGDDAQRGNVSVPCSFPVAVLSNSAQNESAWRSKVRFVMTELVLARYGLDSYRDTGERWLPMR